MKLLCYLGFHDWRQAGPWMHNRQAFTPLNPWPQGEPGSVCEIKCQRCGVEGEQHQAYGVPSADGGPISGADLLDRIGEKPVRR